MNVDLICYFSLAVKMRLFLVDSKLCNFEICFVYSLLIFYKCRAYPAMMLRLLMLLMPLMLLEFSESLLWSGSLATPPTWSAEKTWRARTSSADYCARTE